MTKYLKLIFVVSISIAWVLGIMGIFNIWPDFVYAWEIAMGAWVVAAFAIISKFIVDRWGDVNDDV